MSIIGRLLSGFSVFSSPSEEEVPFIDAILEHIKVKRAEVLLKEGELGDRFVDGYNDAMRNIEKICIALSNPSHEA